MIEQIIVAAIGIAILGAAYLIDLIVGLSKVAFTPSLKFSWAKMGKDLVKAALMAVGILGFVAILNALAWYGELAGADLSVLAAFSFPALVAAIIGGCAWYLGNAFKNIVAFVNSKNVAVTIDPTKADYKAIAEPVVDFLETITTSKEAVAAHAEFEKIGGKGTAYSVPIGNYDEFRNAVNGGWFDIDGYYGAQCWDGAAVLWQQLGRFLSTGGTGMAAGCWNVEAARNANAGGDFDLIWNLNDVKRGDVIVLGKPGSNHIAFADEDYNGSGRLKCLGQNQGVGSGDNGKAFNVLSIGMGGFSGAFRLKRWHTTPPAPEPTPTPPPAQDLTEVVNAVIRGDYGNEPERSANLVAAGYDPVVVQAAVNAQLAGQTPPPASTGISPGDSVVAWGRGTEASDGSGAKTRDFPETTMKVIKIVNGRLALNQYNAGTVDNAADVTGWWSVNNVRKV